MILLSVELLTQELCEPHGLCVVLDGYGASVEEDERDDEPEPVGSLAGATHEEAEALLRVPDVAIGGCRPVGSVAACRSWEGTEVEFVTNESGSYLLTFLVLNGVGLNTIVLVRCHHHLLELFLRLLPCFHDLDPVRLCGPLLGQDEVLGLADPIHIAEGDMLL